MEGPLNLPTRLDVTRWGFRPGSIDPAVFDADGFREFVRDFVAGEAECAAVWEVPEDVRKELADAEDAAKKGAS